jgi:alanyl-tRNA synthetase
VAGGVRALSVLPHEMPAAIERMQADAKDLRKTIKRLQETLIDHEVVRLAGAAQIVDGVHVIVEALDGWDAGGLTAIASAMTAGGRVVVALFSASSPHAVVVARSADVPVDANAVLRALTEQFGGRGGGKPDLAQGGGLTADLVAIMRATRSLLISNPA